MRALGSSKWGSRHRWLGGALSALAGVCCLALVTFVPASAAAAANAASSELPSELHGTVSAETGLNNGAVSQTAQLLTTVTFALVSDSSTSAVYTAQSGTHHWLLTGSAGACTSTGDETFDLQPLSGSITIDKTRSDGARSTTRGPASPSPNHCRARSLARASARSRRRPRRSPGGRLSSTTGPRRVTSTRGQRRSRAV